MTSDAREALNAKRSELFPELVESIDQLLVCMDLANWHGDAVAVHARELQAKSKALL